MRWLKGCLPYCMLLVTGVPLAQASPIVYTLTGATNPAFGPVHPESFRFTAPGFITSLLTVAVAQLDSCVACQTIDFVPNGTYRTIIPLDYIRFTDLNGVVYGFYFAPDTFSEPGRHETFDYPPYVISNPGTLTVQPVPEPSTSAMGILGLLAVVRIRRKPICGRR